MAVVMNVRLPDALAKRIKNIAKSTGKTEEYYIQEAIEEKISDMELICLAIKRLEDVKAGKEEVVSWETVKSQNGL
jgi:predicted DNA-binding protein